MLCAVIGVDAVVQPVCYRNLFTAKTDCVYENLIDNM